MVLAPSEHAWRRMLHALLWNTSFSPVGDHGDQSLWRAFFPGGAHELPAAYNAMKIDAAGAGRFTNEAYVLHDTLFRRWDFNWLRQTAGDGLAASYLNLTVRANELMGSARLKPKRNATRVCYEKMIFRICDEDTGGSD